MRILCLIIVELSFRDIALTQGYSCMRSVQALFKNLVANSRSPALAHLHAHVLHMREPRQKMHQFRKSTRPTKCPRPDQKHGTRQRDDLMELSESEVSRDMHNPTRNPDREPQWLGYFVPGACFVSG